MLQALVVEDDRDIQRLLTELLREQGFDVVTCAGSGAEALRLATALTPDLVVLDYRLGDASGADVAEQLRALPGFDAPVLMTTALPRSRAEEACAAAEACECVVKPFDLDEFLEAVASCLDGRMTPAAA